MQFKKVINERNRLIYLMLFYKNDEKDQVWFINEIKKYNQVIGQKKTKDPEYFENSKNLSVQFEFFLKKFLENSTETNKDKLKTKYLEMVKRHHN